MPLVTLRRSSEKDDPLDRFIDVLRYFLSGWHGALRRSLRPQREPYIGPVRTPGVKKAGRAPATLPFTPVSNARSLTTPSWANTSAADSNTRMEPKGGTWLSRPAIILPSAALRSIGESGVSNTLVVC
jgi:hypothetical protein